MPAEPDLPTPDAPPPTPPTDDTELIAYLDGELDAAASARVEADLARNPESRAAADAYRKSFDLLDYLPKPEPSPDFTSRTITRLQPIVAATQSTPATGVPALPGRRRAWPELLAWSGAAVLVLVLAFVGHSAARPFLHPTPAVEEPSLADLEVIERLPLYLGVEDFAFLKQLDAADLFSDDVTVAPSTPQESPTADDRTKLIAQFRALPQTRQQQLRVLHQDLEVFDEKTGASLRGTLQGYASWLDRLPESERKKVLGASTGAERLTEIRQVKEAQWRASLTPRQKELLRNVTNVQDRENLAAEFRLQESRRREEWELAHRQWQMVSEKGRKPWPFDDPKRMEQVDAFIRGSLGADLSAAPPNRGGGFQPDPQPHCRLNSSQFVELKTLHEAARKEGGWAWMQYGACLLRLADTHPSYPLPREGKPTTTIDTLPKEYKPFFVMKGGFDPKGGPPKIAGWMTQSGRWPDFALQIHDRKPKFGNFTPLGPCKPDECSEEVAKFVKEQLLPKLSTTDADALKAAEGKWPEYPKKLLEVARRADLAIPGVTLPGEPSKWDRLYRTPVGKK